MFDLLRRLIGGESRPVDLWVIVIELLVLAIILIDSLWDKAHRFSAWKDLKRKRSALVIQLGKLTPSESETLRHLYIEGLAPSLAGHTLKMRLGPHVIDYGHAGWYICSGYKDLIEEWSNRPVTPPSA